MDFRRLLLTGAAERFARLPVGWPCLGVAYAVGVTVSVDNIKWVMLGLVCTRGLCVYALCVVVCWFGMLLRIVAEVFCVGCWVGT